MCVKRKTKTNNFTRPAVRLEHIEDGIATFYCHFKVKPEHAEQIRAVRQELVAQQAEASRSLERATARKTRVTDERHKLLQAHYAGAFRKTCSARGCSA
jgi:hypothetical protein